MTTPFEMIVSKDLDRNQSPLDAFGWTLSATRARKASLICGRRRGRRDQCVDERPRDRTGGGQCYMP